MQKIFLGAALAAAMFTIALAADAPPAAAPKGTVCFAREFRNTEQYPIACKGVGSFPNVASIYERGYRVVSTAVVSELGSQTLLIFIEERT